MKNKRLALMISILGVTIVTLGISYAVLNLTLTGKNNSVLVTGDIYMNYTESNQINLENAVPMSKEDALELETNVFDFTIAGKNQSSKDIYYGISIVYGDNQEGKTRLKDEDIGVYLKSGEDVLLDGNRYTTLNNTRIWAEKIGANTENYSKKFSLRMWVDENVIISDTDANKDYTLETWNKSYASYKVKVDGNFNEMNVPLEIDGKDSNYENGRAYFILKVSNYLSPVATIADGGLQLDITSTNKDVQFSYKDNKDHQVEDEEPVGSISQKYSLTDKEQAEIQVYVTSKSDADIKADINIKLTGSSATYQMVKNMHIRGAKDYCKNNGFTNFAECLLVSEQLSNDVASAKAGIKGKGQPTLSKTAPVITYAATNETVGASVPQNNAFQWAYADTATFDTNNGTFTLSGNVKTGQSLTSAMNDKWTCGTTGNNITNCATVYHITSMEGNTIKTASSRTYQIANAIGSEVGLYSTQDDVGDSFYYRGDVQNNNVKFAGFYWKVVRVNGDGSVRLLYNGTKANSNGYDASSVTNAGVAYNTRFADPAYVGYMYGDSFSTEPVKSKTTASYGDIQANTKYYFAKAYSGDNANKTFKLTNADYSGTFTEWNTANKLAEGYKYTCKSTSATGTCQFLMEITKFNNATSVTTYFWTYGSTSYENTRKDNASSNAKTQLENWYTTKLAVASEAGQTADKYIETNATFCNDRSLSSQGGNGDGYTTAPTTFYGAYDRNVNKKVASLKCPTAADLFSASGATKGNQKLAKPIGLLTADEVALAGGLYNTKNERYYLYTGQYFWTMSPIYFNTWNAYAYGFDVRSAGEFSINFVTASAPGVRAVINLKSSVLLAGGNGTSADPYTLKLS